MQIILFMVMAANYIACLYTKCQRGWSRGADA